MKAKFKTLKHKKLLDTFAEPFMFDPDDGVSLRQTPVPLLQPEMTTMEQIRQAYMQGDIDATVALEQLEEYELVDIEISINE